jgi:hypothetical protein
VPPALVIKQGYRLFIGLLAVDFYVTLLSSHRPQCVMTRPWAIRARRWASGCPAARRRAKGHDLLEVTFPDDVDLSSYHIVEEDEDGTVVAAWEWCVPAALINDKATVRLLSEAEEDELAAQLFEMRSIGGVSRLLDDLAARPLTWENSVSEGERTHKPMRADR